MFQVEISCKINVKLLKEYQVSLFFNSGVNTTGPWKLRALKSLKIVKPIIQKVNQISKRSSAMFTLVTGSFELYNKNK